LARSFLCPQEPARLARLLTLGYRNRGAPT
jgi:hypothetical protein